MNTLFTTASGESVRSESSFETLTSSLCNKSFVSLIEYLSASTALVRIESSLIKTKLGASSSFAVSISENRYYSMRVFSYEGSSQLLQRVADFEAVICFHLNILFGKMPCAIEKYL